MEFVRKISGFISRVILSTSRLSEFIVLFPFFQAVDINRGGKRPLPCS